MPDMSQLSEILYLMQDDTVPEYKKAVNDFLAEGFSTEKLLSIIKMTSQPSSALINAYLYVCQIRNEPINIQLQKVADLDAIIAEKQRIIAEAEAQVRKLNAQIIELEETALLQDFGLYQPTYDFATSVQYKERLDDIRTEQKYSLQGTTQGNGLTGGLPPVRFSM